MLTGQSRPNSACAKRKVTAYFAAGGSGAGQPKTPARWLIAARPNSPKAMRSISR